MRCLTIIGCLIFSINLSLATPLTDRVPQFDLKLANIEYDKINLQLSTQNLNFEHLNKAINTLSVLTDNADQCVNVAQKRLGNIDTLIQQSTHLTDKNINGADLVYLTREQKNLAETQSQCRLFSIRAKEAIDAYKVAAARLTQKETLVRIEPLWEITSQLIINFPTTINSTSFPPLPTVLKSPLMWALLSVVSLLISTLFLLKLRKSRFARRYLRIRRLQRSQILLLATTFITGAIFFYLTLLVKQTNEIILIISELVFSYFSIWLFIAYFLKIKRIRLLLYWYSLDKRFFHNLFLFFLNVYIISTLASLLAQACNLNSELWSLLQSVWLLIVMSIEIVFIYYFCRAHRNIPFIQQHQQLIKQLGGLILISFAIICILGYYTLSLRLTWSGFTTFVIVFITILIVQGINKIYFSLTHDIQIQSRVIKYFGYKQDQAFTELLILKITLQFIILTLSLFLIFHNWEFATYYIENIFTQFFYGIHLANSTVYPTRIVLGVVVYCVMYLMFKAISTTISRHQQFENEEETQVAIASIFTYLGFAIAIISALLVAGFNFTGLAIVAGALSVGIGLGLQSIVNNFVSGLILLIEKPIKPGDRINIDGVEGFVKKIRVRSTHIITPLYEDIIVPNSDLITKRVTNYVYSNKQLSITCDINVPFGSDTKKVRDLLLEAACAHADVIKHGRDRPYVLFRSFGEKALIFQVCCIIKDVNKKLMVISDLNFAIDELLRKVNI